MMIRTIPLAMHATAFIILLGQSKLSVLASPVPISPARINLPTTHSFRSESNTTQNSLVIMGFAKDISTGFRSSSAEIAPNSSTTHSFHQRDNPDSPRRYLNQAMEHSNKLSMYFVIALVIIHLPRHAESLARQSPNVAQNDVKFQGDCTSQLLAYQTNLLDFQEVLARLDSDKGLANYDPSDPLETLLKDMINMNKDTLRCCVDIVKNVPGLGPVLGPSKSFTQWTTNLLTSPFSSLSSEMYPGRHSQPL
jgi:hypothetical protein